MTQTKTDGGKKRKKHSMDKQFLSRTPVTQELRSTIGKWHFMKFKSLYMTKETIETAYRT